MVQTIGSRIMIKFLPDSLNIKTPFTEKVTVLLANCFIELINLLSFLHAYPTVNLGKSEIYLY